MMDQRGYNYKLHHKNAAARKSIWRCKKYDSKKEIKCYARAWTIGSFIIKFKGEHCHSPESNLNKKDLESVVFQHFIPNADTDKVKCEHCSEEFDVDTSAHDLESHLLMNHDITF